MGLLDEVKSEKVLHSGVPYSLLPILDSMTLDDAQDFVEALFDREIPVVALERALKKRGYNISYHVISQTRNGKRATVIPAKFYR